MYDIHRTCAITTYFLLVSLVICAIGAKNRYNILIVQSDMMIPRIVDTTWRIDFPGAEKIMLSDAILYFSTTGKMINAEKWFVEFEKLFNSKGMNPEDHEILHRTVANDVGLVVVLANPSGIVTHSFTWRHWNSYMIRTAKEVKIGFVDCVESRDETVEDKMVTVRNELAKLNGMDVNITMALTRKSSDLVPHVRGKALVDLILESDGGIWTKYGWKQIGTSQSLGAMLLIFNKDGLIEELETNEPDLVSDSGRQKRSDNETEALSTDKNQTSSYRNRNEIFVASDVIARYCQVKGDCAFGNLVADAIAYYARWRLSTPSRHWSKYPIAFFSNNRGKNVELRRGYMSLNTFLRAFASIDERLCVLHRRGRTIKNILRKFRGSYHMPTLQISGMYVWTDGYRPRVVTSRCSAGCRDYSLNQMGDWTKYCIIGPKSTIDRLLKIRIFFWWKKCKKLSSTVGDALRHYASDKRDIFPQAEWRYWSASRRTLKSMKSGCKTEDIHPFGWFMNLNVVLVFFTLDITYVVN